MVKVFVVAYFAWPGEELEVLLEVLGEEEEVLQGTGQKSKVNLIFK